MTAGLPPQRFSLSRWSRRKLAATAAPASGTSAVPAAAVPAAAAPATAAQGLPVAPAAPDLPPVDSLTFDSDFAVFLQPGVDDTIKRAALKQLFRDPRFNIMDGLDTYIDDYTKADPIPPDIIADLLQRGFGPAPEADGVTEDVNALASAPPEPAAPGLPDLARPVAVAQDGRGATASARSPVDEQGTETTRSADGGGAAVARDDVAGEH